MPKKTTTYSFGVSKREGHDSSPFYSRSLYSHATPASIAEDQADYSANQALPTPQDWCDKIFNQSSESMPLPDASIALAFTSPPYNVGKDYEADLSMDDYFSLIEAVGREVYRLLKPGGRYVINVANLGRKPYLPMHSYFYQVHGKIGFLPMGEIIWQKALGANGSCAWGSWGSAKAPRIRDIHEYLLVFAKGEYSRPERGESDISRDEFLASTLSVWQIPPESAKKVGHPAPFPVELAARVIRLYSYVGDVILDPFAGSGTTCVAAKRNQRHYVGFDIVKEYCQLAEERCKSV